MSNIVFIHLQHRNSTIEKYKIPEIVDRKMLQHKSYYVNN